MLPKYNSQCYHPAWGSLACDYLAVMSSSVSSECAFLQGGITISKRCNCLKGNIVETLQCIKSKIHHALLFQHPVPSSRMEAEKHDEESEDVLEGDSGNPDMLDIDGYSWDELLIEDDDNDMIEWSDSE
jgi:hAT family protein